MFTTLDISNNLFTEVPDTFRLQSERYLNSDMYPWMGDVVLNIGGNQMYCDDTPQWLIGWNLDSGINIIGYPGDQNCL